MKSFRSFPLFGSAETLLPIAATLMFSIHTTMLSYLPSCYLQRAQNDFKCFSPIPTINTIVKHVKGLLTRTKVVRLPKRAQKNVLFSLYDVGFLFVPSSETCRVLGREKVIIHEMKTFLIYIVLTVLGTSIASNNISAMKKVKLVLFSVLATSRYFP